MLVCNSENFSMSACIRPGQTCSGQRLLLSFSKCRSPLAVYLTIQAVTPKLLSGPLADHDQRLAQPWPEIRATRHITLFAVFAKEHVLQRIRIGGP